MARTAGELWAVSDVADLLEMPVLAAFLEERGALLQEVAVDVMLHVASTRALSQVLVAESEAMAEGNAELADAGLDLAARGIEELAVAQAAAGAARDLAAEGVAEAVVGGTELGAAAVMAGGSRGRC